MCVRSIVAFAVLAIAIEAGLQTITVTGTTVCHRRRVAGVLVALMERDTDWFDTDDLLQEVRSDANGDFTLTGSESELGTITPYIRISHECDAKPNCKRIAEYDAPTDKIGSTYEMTYISMNIAVKDEKEECP
ncbi:hypothetical protein PMAYCL1PPCAC_00265 [Pristionchus mayeri]|uniref:Transthyretin-like family protein n=1 Tax=Pristionchus mayeri TaxID=1317129 RepID=A0AAN4Z2K0_9BILA|nr:hypothetical protein PMAYCL1PPCAC_00265 [Pristionchus mayeri]